jgi:hypothetical protein
LLAYMGKCLGLKDYLRQPGDGRSQPRISPRLLLWSMVIARVLRETSFHAVEQLAHAAGRALGFYRRFGDDALGYFTERLDPSVTRSALIAAVRRAKRNKAFEGAPFIGLAIDGTAAGRSAKRRCALCRPYRNAQKDVAGYCHHLTTISIVGAGLSLPFDAEPYGPGDSEYAAGQRLLARASSQLGARFADYLVVDSEYATAPFLHAAGHAGLHVVARLKNNLPELSRAVEKRFGSRRPTRVYHEGNDRIEVWDAADFDPWETLRWETVRVIRYRQHHSDGSLVQADWLTNFSPRQVGSLSLYHMAKSRWEIENQGFNDAKNRYGFEHICHHHPNSLLIGWLLTFLTLIVERLYRLRYLHRGTHPVCSADQLCRLFWLSLSAARSIDTS